MADKKISALTAATTPLAGTEVLPIVQSSTTKQVSVANLTAGRAVSALSVTTTGEVSTSGALRVTGAYATNAANQLAFQNSAGVGALYVNGASTGAGNRGTFVMWQQDSAGGNYLQTLGVDVNANVTVTSGNLVQGTAAKGINFTANTPAAGMTSQLLNWYEEGTWTPTDASGAGLTFTSATGRYTRMGNVVFLFGYVQYPTTASGANASIGGLPFTVNASAAATQGGVTYSQVATVRSVGVQSSTTTATVYTLAGGVATNADLSATALYFNSTYFV